MDTSIVKHALASERFDGGEVVVLFPGVKYMGSLLEEAWSA
jgi:hypothetical protein